LDRIKIAIVVSEFNNEITYKMLDFAKKYAYELSGATLRYVCYVPGCFDMPLIINEMLKRRDVDAVITLGAIIKGETRHDELIANSIAKSFIDLSLKYSKPVTLGISGPDMTLQQARERVEIISSRAVNAAIMMARRLKKLRGQRSRMNRTTEVII
jgi:6,7-dimethyl-8-ribityllumazine synthase